LTGLELWRASLKMGIELTSDELQEIRDKLDANHDGRISLAEFQAFVEGAAPSQATYREHLRTSTYVFM
jgi:Ca2+-binding EF-hand superfamily protein